MCTTKAETNTERHFLRAQYFEQGVQRRKPEPAGHGMLAGGWDGLRVPLEEEVGIERARRLSTRLLYLRTGLRCPNKDTAFGVPRNIIYLQIWRQLARKMGVMSPPFVF